MGAVAEEARAGVAVVSDRGVVLVRLRRRVGSFALAPVYSLYTRRLRGQVRSAVRPHHVAVILDWNRRWASSLGFRELGAGHRQGADKLDELLGWCLELGIGELTVWALSGENLTRRASDELGALLAILAEKLSALAERHRAEGVRIRVFGRLETLPASLVETARELDFLRAVRTYQQRERRFGR